MLQGLQSSSQDSHFVVLQTLKKLFKKYRYSFATKELVDEMLYVIPSTGHVLLNMMKSYSDFLSESLATKNTPNSNLALSLIGDILHVFYSLNCVELPEFFEDSMAQWMTYFKFILEIKDSNESLIKCKTNVIKNVSLYCEKYASDFVTYFQPFFSLIWSQVELTTMEAEYDKVKNNKIVYSSFRVF